MSSVQQTAVSDQSSAVSLREPEAIQEWPLLDEEEEADTVGLRRWTWEEYYRAAELGLFKPGERLELIDGKVYRNMAAKNRPHAIALSRSARVLEATFGSDYHAQREQPLLLSGDTEPEPDLVILKGLPEDYPKPPGPADALLVMEVSDTTYGYDTRKKASLYASAGIPEYWVLDLKRRRLEVRLEPQPDPEARFGYSYQRIHRLREEETVAPLAAPQASISVASLLPPSQPEDSRLEGSE
jgi:Uma2 family endonuclease